MKKHATILSAALLIFLSALCYAQAPVPFINLPLLPDATAPGGPQFSLTVNGTGFVSNSVVNWNGTPLATQFVNGSQLTATVPAADLASAGTGWVTVFTPSPGGGTSNTAFFTATANAGNSVGFGLASSPFIGKTTYAIATGDFNGDGKLDLAVTDIGINRVTVLLGDGKGNFTPVSSLPTGVYPEGLVVGDFNGDGKLDLAVSNVWSNSVQVFLGDGTGHFTQSCSLSSGLYHPIALAAGDFNGDGNLDLVAVNSRANLDGSVSVLLGDGTGNFTLGYTPIVGYGPDLVAVGDFNGDGKLDLAVATYGEVVSILIGQGNGNFTLGSSFGIGAYPDFQMGVGDLNGDGILDLAVPTETGMLILTGDETGNFTVSSSLTPGASDSVILGDFNGDGNLDLVAASSPTEIFLGDGKGNFTVGATMPSGFVTMAIGDFNGDGKLDLALTNGASTISIWLAAAPPVLLSPTNVNFGTQTVGTLSAPQTVTLTNFGTTTLHFTSIVASPNFYAHNDCGSSLAAGAGCTITAAFKPHQLGKLTGAITIADDGATSPQTIPLTGVGHK